MIKNITETIKYIGVDDTDIDLFESQYVVPNGVSYNSYVIFDEKIAIMDTVDPRKGSEWIENLQCALDGCRLGKIQFASKRIIYRCFILIK